MALVFYTTNKLDATNKLSNWDTLHVRLNSNYKAWSWKKTKRLKHTESMLQVSINSRLKSTWFLPFWFFTVKILFWYLFSKIIDHSSEPPVTHTCTHTHTHTHTEGGSKVWLPPSEGEIWKIKKGRAYSSCLLFRIGPERRWKYDAGAGLLKRRRRSWHFYYLIFLSFLYLEITLCEIVLCIWRKQIFLPP